MIDGKWEALDQENILEEVGYSRFSQSPGRHPKDGRTIPEAGKPDAYTWIKAPRYRGQAMEVGPLARAMVNYLDPSETWIRNEVNAFLAAAEVPAAKLNSVLGRHAVRGLEALWVGKQADNWLSELEVDGPPAQDFTIPKTASGYGLTERLQGVGALAVDRQLSDQELPVRRADHLELLAAQRQGTARPGRTGSGRHDRRRSGTADRSCSHRSIFRPLHRVRGALITAGTHHNQFSRSNHR